MPILSCQNISKVYSHDFSWWKKKTALVDVSFDLEEGEVFGIVGPNGAGKSTSLKILMGFIQPTTGSATINGLPCQPPLSHSQIGFLPETPSLYPHLSISEHLTFACKLAGLPNRQIKNCILEVLETVQLQDIARDPIKNFSKGMTQRAALAYALVLNPEILILDEPMSGLDPLGRQLVIDIIREYNGEGTTILFCSHILTDIERVCNRIGIMNKGTILSIITPHELQQKYPQDILRNGQTPLEAFFLESIRGGTA